MQNIKKHEAHTGINIAWLGDGPDACANDRCGLFWLGGFMSDMAGSKAEMLAQRCIAQARSCVRFDYSGHGASDGSMRESTISNWLDESVQMFTRHAAGPRVVIGSSMGGWLALLLARYLSKNDVESAARIKGLVLIAPAADMTDALMWNKYDAGIRSEIENKGFYAQSSEYDDQPYIITRELIEDGRKHLLLADGLDVGFPVRILQGDLDPDVPWQHALATYRALRGPDITFSLVKGADHRLSTPGNLELLAETCAALCERADGD